MIDHLQTILVQQVSVSVLVVINQISLRHDDADIDNVCHLFFCTIMSFLTQIRKKECQAKIIPVSDMTGAKSSLEIHSHTRNLHSCEKKARKTTPVFKNAFSLTTATPMHCS